MSGREPELLSQEEIDALLAQIEAEVAGAAGAGTAGAGAAGAGAQAGPAPAPEADEAAPGAREAAATAAAAVAPGAEPAVYPELTAVPGGRAQGRIDLLLDVPLEVTVELGRTRRQVRELLALGPGALIELDKLAGEPVDVLVNGKPVARGEVVVIDEYFGVRITEILSPAERLQRLR